MGPSAAPSLSRCDTGASGHFPAHDERRPGLARCRPALGTYVKIALRGASDDELIEHSRAAFAEIERVERALSFHDPHSELSRVNREAATRPLRLSQDLRTVLDFGSRLSRSTGGLFDVTVAPELVRRGALPDHGVDVGVQASWHDVRLEGDTVRFDRPLLIDLGGIAKGYAVDRAMAVIPPEVAATVNAGGDLRMRPWRDETLAVEVPDGRR
ncbi:MAG: FAD:protein FMN transferase, partial [Acidobacteriota bacterium]